MTLILHCHGRVPRIPLILTFPLFGTVADQACYTMTPTPNSLLPRGIRTHLRILIYLLPEGVRQLERNSTVQGPLLASCLLVEAQILKDLSRGREERIRG